MAEHNIPGVYAIRNSADGRLYIGSTVRTVGVRFREHRKLLRKGRHHSPYLQRAWGKYGEAAFDFHLLEVVFQVSHIAEREQYWIDVTRAADKKFGFNICAIARSSLGRKVSAETRQKIARGHIGKPASAETRAKMSASRMGRQFSEETRQKISAAQKGAKRKPLSADHRAKISAGGKGRIVSKETRERMSLAAKNRPPVSVETRRLQSLAKLGVKLSEENKAEN